MSLTDQQVFDRVAAHLLAQGERSNEGVSCLYRGPYGRRCAVGCLISDEAYDPEMEGHSVRQLIANFRPSIPDYFDTHRALLGRLQSVHDSMPCSSWRECLRIVGEDFGLKTEAALGAP